jgi:NADH-quinone oxidoreductase subunit M
VTLALIGVPASSGFVGAARILQGVYVVNRLWAVAAVAGLVLGAVFMLRLYQRTMFGRASTPAIALRDLTGREIAVLAPLVALAIWIGVHPAPVLRTLETSMGRVVARVNPVYGPHLAQGSDCATPAAPEPAGPPAGFVLVEPCADPTGADQKPKPTPVPR